MACRCCGCRSTRAIRCSALGSRRCSRRRIPCAAPSSAMRVIGRVPTGARITSARAIRPRFASAWGCRRRRFEYAAYDHVDAAPHLRQYVTKALAMHLADSVWSATERHLFRDTTGARQGMPGVSRLVRLHAATRSCALAYQGAHVGDVPALRLARRPSRRVHRRRRMLPAAAAHAPDRRADAIVVGLRRALSRSCSRACPAARSSCRCGCRPSPSNQPILDHHLADPERWHKIDVVRRRDPNAAGGWRYEAHLMVLVAPYVAPAVAARRERAAENDRRSPRRHRRQRLQHHGRVARARARSACHARRARRRRQGARDQAGSARAAPAARPRSLASRGQSRRSTNCPSARTSAPVAARPRACHRRRSSRAGPRRVRSDGKPLQAYRKDQLSRSVPLPARGAGRRRRVRHAGPPRPRTSDRRVARRRARLRARRRGHRPAELGPDVGPRARRVLARHAPRRDRARGRARSLVSPASSAASCVRRLAPPRCRSTACAALASPRRSATASTTASRVDLRGDRDAVAATLAACVRVEPNKPASAAIDHSLTAALLYDLRTRTVLLDTLPESVKGRQDVPSESTAHSARDGSFVAEKGPTSHRYAVRWLGEPLAWRRVQPRMSLARYQTTSERTRMRTNLTGDCAETSTQLRDSS